MELKFEVSARIARPVDVVFEAIVNPDHVSSYFASGGAEGRLETGATVYWSFKEVPGRFPVEVVEVEKNKRIIFKWDSNDAVEEEGGKYQTTVTIRFETLDDGRTLVSVAEEGWRETAAGQKSSYDNCSGWGMVLSALKAYLDHGIILREGMHM